MRTNTATVESSRDFCHLCWAYKFFSYLPLFFKGFAYFSWCFLEKKEAAVQLKRTSKDKI